MITISRNELNIASYRGDFHLIGAIYFAGVARSVDCRSMLTAKCSMLTA